MRYLPLIAITEIFALYIVPLLGAGPVWNNYEELVMKPCKEYWWTNLLYVNNIVPSNGSFDDKCMPWAWFIPCMVQVSMILPPLLFLVTKAVERSYGTMRLMFATITLSCWTLVFVLTYTMDLGSIPITILPTNGDDDPNKLFYLDF